MSHCGVLYSLVLHHFAAFVISHMSSYFIGSSVCHWRTREGLTMYADTHPSLGLVSRRAYRTYPCWSGRRDSVSSSFRVEPPSWLVVIYAIWYTKREMNRRWASGTRLRSQMFSPPLKLPSLVISRYTIERWVRLALAARQE